LSRRRARNCGSPEYTQQGTTWPGAACAQMAARRTRGPHRARMVPPQGGFVGPGWTALCEGLRLARARGCPNFAGPSAAPAKGGRGGEAHCEWFAGSNGKVDNGLRRLREVAV